MTNRDKALANIEGLRRLGRGLAITPKQPDKSDKFAHGRNRSTNSTNSRKSGDLLNENDVAGMLSVSVQTLRRWRMLKRGPQFVKVGFLVRYKPDAVAAWLNAQPTGGSK